MIHLYIQLLTVNGITSISVKRNGDLQQAVVTDARSFDAQVEKIVELINSFKTEALPHPSCSLGLSLTTSGGALLNKAK